MPRTADRLGYIKYINICFLLEHFHFCSVYDSLELSLTSNSDKNLIVIPLGSIAQNFFTYDMKTKWGIFLRLGSICSEAKIQNFLVSELVKDLWASSYEGHHLCTNQNSKGQKPVSVPGCKSTGPRTEPAPLEWSRSLALCSAFSALLTDPPLIAAERKKKG